MRGIFLAVLMAVTMTATPAPAATFVYVGNAESNEVWVLALDRQSGDLTVVEKVGIPGITKPGNSTPMAVSPDRRILYVGTRGEPKIVAGFAIDPASGRLKHLASGPLPDSMAYISTDRTGRYLLGASYPGHKVTVSPIGPPGTVQPAQQILPDHPNAHAILADAGNRHVLVPTLGNDKVNQFDLDPTTGQLAPASPPSVSVKEKAGPRHFVFHPNGRIVYVIGELDGVRLRLRLRCRPGAAQAEAERERAPAGLPGQAVGGGPARDARRPLPLRLGAHVEHPGRLPGESVDGTLTAIGSVATEKQPRGFNIDSTGRYLLAVGQLSHALSSYRIDPESGKLTKLKEYPMGQNPNWVEILDFP